MDVRRAVEGALDRVAPIVRADGGEIDLVEVTADGLVRVRLRRACAGCPGAQYTVHGLLARELKSVEGFREIEVLPPVPEGNGQGLKVG